MVARWCTIGSTPHPRRPIGSGMPGQVLVEEKLAENAEKMGEIFRKGLNDIKSHLSKDQVKLVPTSSTGDPGPGRKRGV